MESSWNNKHVDVKHTLQGMNAYPNKWEVWTNSSSSSTPPETALLGGHASRFFLLRPIHPMSSPGSQAMQRQEPSCNYCWPRYRGIGCGKAKHPDFLTFSCPKNPFFWCCLFKENHLPPSWVFVLAMAHKPGTTHSFWAELIIFL